MPSDIHELENLISLVNLQLSFVENLKNFIKKGHCLRCFDQYFKQSSINLRAHMISNSADTTWREFSRNEELCQNVAGTALLMQPPLVSVFRRSSRYALHNELCFAHRMKFMQ